MGGIYGQAVGFEKRDAQFLHILSPGRKDFLPKSLCEIVMLFPSVRGSATLYPLL